MGTQHLIATLIFIGFIYVAFAEDNNTMEAEEDSSKERKKDDGLRQMFMMVMMVKSTIQTIVSLITPVIQIKGLIISSIMAVVNIARLVMSIKQYHEKKKEAPPPSWAHNRRYAATATLPPHVQAIYLPNYSDDRRI